MTANSTERSTTSPSPAPATVPKTQAYIAKRISQGKTTREARRCLKRYIARHLYRLLENPPPNPPELAPTPNHPNQKAQTTPTPEKRFANHRSIDLQNNRSIPATIRMSTKPEQPQVGSSTCIVFSPPLPPF